MKNEKYVKDLLKKYSASIKAIRAAKTPDAISVQERTFMPLMNELMLAIPRLGDDMHQEAIKRRKEILEGK